VVAGFIKQHFHSTKINFAALGNLVPQLHLHVIGRSISDPCWPKPVWDNLGSEKIYSDTEVELIRKKLHLGYNLN
jgi:diadenosine tetraphosphate (Ap4A) HIT family hydrolase